MHVLLFILALAMAVTTAQEQRTIVALGAGFKLMPFAWFTRPTADAPMDVTKSRYIPRPHHHLIAEALERVENGQTKRLMLVLPPRHGKTELAVRSFVPWAMGRKPDRHVIVATYSDTFSSDHGRDVRDILQSSSFREVFPAKGAQLRHDSQAVDRLALKGGGAAMFVGRGGSITGRGADIFLIDDPIKDNEEAQSPVIREKLWQWFAEVVTTRLMTGDGAIVLIQTRWHEDDLVGRLTDPRNSCYSADEAKRWTVLRLPALAEDNDPVGRAKGEALWPERFSREYLEEVRGLSARSFSALWQGNPTPDEGTFFKSEYLLTYQPHELPSRLRYYAASDHAVSLTQERDATCLLPAGVDERGDLWVLPDVFWARKDSKDVVDAMLGLMRRYKPIFWWAESGHITKSIGPFLRDRMQEEGVNCAIDEVTPVKDKQTRAQSIQGRCAMRRVHLPAFAPWWPDALDELLKFPNGAHDDFVDALAHLGMGLDRLMPAQGEVKYRDPRPKPGTLAWVMASAKEQQRRKDLLVATQGF